MRHDPGLAASPPVGYILEVERSGYSSFHLPFAVDGQPPREAAAYGGTSAQEDLLWAYGCSRGARRSSPSSARPARTSSRSATWKTPPRGAPSGPRIRRFTRRQTCEPHSRVAGGFLHTSLAPSSGAVHAPRLVDAV